MSALAKEIAEAVFAAWGSSRFPNQMPAAIAAADAAIQPLVEALVLIAAEAFVGLDELPPHDAPNGWRRIAVERIDIARAALAVLAAKS